MIELVVVFGSSIWTIVIGAIDVFSGVKVDDLLSDCRNLRCDSIIVLWEPKVGGGGRRREGEAGATSKYISSPSS